MTSSYDKRRVLFTASTYSHIEHFHLPYLREFKRLGWEVHIACGNGPAEAPFTDKSFDLPFQKSMTSPENFRASWMLRGIIRSEGYSLITTHTSLAAFFTRLAVKGMKPRPRLINVVHGYLFDGGTPAVKRSLLLNAERLTASETDLLLTMNRYDYELAKQYRLGREIDIIPGIGVDFSRLEDDQKRDSDITREVLGISPEAFILIYAAEFSGRKSQDVLIRAMTYLPEDTVLVLCGDGVELSRCRELAGRSGLAERVLFPGRIENMAAWYRLADAAVTASRSEGLPFNVMEAMYLGLPVVASRVKGHTDLIEDGSTGLLYSYGDSQECADRVRMLMTDVELRRRIGRRAADSVTQFGIDSVLPMALERYDAAAHTPVNSGRTAWLAPLL